MTRVFPISAEELIPQRPPMRLLESLHGYEAGSGEGRLRVPQEGLFVDRGGRFTEAGLVEVMAQLSAAVNGYESREAAQPNIGYLVGLKHVRFEGAARAGDELIIESRRTFQLAPVSFQEAGVRHGEDAIAEGTLKTYEESGRPPEAAQAEEPSHTTEPAMDEPPSDSVERIVTDQTPLFVALAESAVGVRFVSRDEAEIRFVLQDALPAFQGHFPGFPILPGVALLEMGRLAASILLERSQRFAYIDHAKFTRLVRPGQTVDVAVRLHEPHGDEGPRRMHTRFTHGREKVATCTFDAADARTR